MISLIELIQEKITYITTSTLPVYQIMNANYGKLTGKKSDLTYKSNQHLNKNRNNFDLLFRKITKLIAVY